MAEFAGVAESVNPLRVKLLRWRLGSLWRPGSLWRLGRLWQSRFALLLGIVVSAASAQDQPSTGGDGSEPPASGADPAAGADPSAGADPAAGADSGADSGGDQASPLPAEGEVPVLRARMTDLTPFLAGDALTPPFARPLRWLDAESYLAFDRVEVLADGESDTAVRPAEEGVEAVKTFLRIDARLGTRTALLDMALLADRLREEQVDTSTVATALADPSRFQWSRDVSRCVLNVGRDLYLVDAASGAVEQVTVDSQTETWPHFSPDGTRLAYVSQFNVFVVDIADMTSLGRPVQVTTQGSEAVLLGRVDGVYREEVWGRFSDEGLFWSPNGEKLAILRLDESEVHERVLVDRSGAQPTMTTLRYPTPGSANPVADFGILDVDRALAQDAGAVSGADGYEPVRWVKTAADDDADRLLVGLGWHPGGQDVWFQVQDRAQSWLELHAVASESGETRRLFHEESDCWVENGSEPYWLEDGVSFLWQSERSGYEHLYRYTWSGDFLGQVTRGAFDVEAIRQVDEQRGMIWFSSDRPNPGQLHVWSCDLVDGGNMTQVTSGRGWHDVWINDDCTTYLDHWSAIDHRGTHRVHDLATGEVIRTLVESNMSELDPFGLRPPEFLEVPTRDGFVMRAVMIKPPDYQEGRRYPVLCHVYSGPHAPRTLDRWRERDYLWHQLMAQRGYLIWICDNRSASGISRDLAKSCHRRFGMEATADLEDGVRFLIDGGYADPERVGMWGWSFGGYQTLYCLTHSDLWSVGIAINPVTDWLQYDSIYTERYMGLPQDNADGYLRASILPAVGNLRGKLFLAHATLDRNVPFQHSLRLVHALQQAGKDFEFMPYPGVGHSVFDRRQQEHLFRAMAGFLVVAL